MLLTQALVERFGAEPVLRLIRLHVHYLQTCGPITPALHRYAILY